MTKIESLTPEQEAQLEVYRDKWLAIGLSTEPLDEAEAIAAVENLYTEAGHDKPTITFVDGPSKIGSGDLWVGQFSAHWLGFYEFFQDNFGLCPQIIPLLRVGKSCGSVALKEGEAIICRRPTKIAMVDGKLHCENGPSVQYADGTEVYSWNGTRVPKKWIMEADTIDPAEILREVDVELRTVGCDIIGWARVASELDRKVLDGDPNSDIGALVELTLPDLPEPGRFLMAMCPRNGQICEEVPRVSDVDNLPIETAIAAQAWRDMLPQSEYTHPTIRM
jgi:hypothetical protein